MTQSELKNWICWFLGGSVVFKHCFVQMSESHILDVSNAVIFGMYCVWGILCQEMDTKTCISHLQTFTFWLSGCVFASEYQLCLKLTKWLGKNIQLTTKTWSNNFILIGTQMHFGNFFYYDTINVWQIRNIWRYQRNNQKPSIEGQTIQWPKRQRKKPHTNIDLQIITHKIKDWTMRTPLKLGRFSSSYSPCDNRCIIAKRQHHLA